MALIPQFSVGDIRKNVKENSKNTPFEPAPAGTYVLTCVGCELGTSKKGEPKLTFTDEVVEGPDGQRGKKIVSSGSLQPHALFSIQNRMDACGIEKDSVEHLDTEDFVGKSFRCEITVEEYQTTDGETRYSNQLKRLRALIKG